MPRRNFLRTILCGLAAMALAIPLASQSTTAVRKPAAPSPTRPKLILAIVVDQFRYDYLTRFNSELTGGLRRLWDQGAVFTNANYESWPTVTAIGHSQILSGATPSTSGIVGNDWWDRNEKKRVLSITDDTVQMVGATGAGASPRRMLTSTIGDELKISGKGGKVIGVSLKDRSAILPAGHMADAAYWFNGATGGFVSSTYYETALPAWAAQYDQTHPADKYAGQTFLSQTMPTKPGSQLYAAVDAAPFGDELVLDFALKSMAGERLGMGAKTDLLSVSFSSVDYVGHSKGPDSPEIHAMVLAVDKVVGKLLDAAQKQAGGAANLLVVFTADHGVAPVPEENQKRKLPGGRLNIQAERTAVEAALKEQFGEGQFLASVSESGIYINPDAVPGKKFDLAAMEQVAANALRAQPHVYRVYTRSGFRDGAAVADRIDQRVRNGFNSDRSANVMIVHDPYWQSGTSGTTHGTPFSYDSHVPVIFLGSAGTIRPGHYNRDVGVNDIAPTLATLLGVATPSGAQGRALAEMIKDEMSK